MFLAVDGASPQSRPSESVFPNPKEGGRNRNVNLSGPRYQECEVLADLGLGCTEEDFPIRAPASGALEEGPGFIELGVEQTVLVGLYCPAEVVKPGARFELSEGPRGVRSEVYGALRDRVILAAAPIHPTAWKT